MGIFPDQQKVAIVSHKYEPVPLPILAHLPSVGGEPSVFTGAFDLHDTALGKLSWLGLSLLALASGKQSKIGMPRTLISELRQTKYLRREVGANRVQEAFENRVI